MDGSENRLTSISDAAEASQTLAEQFFHRLTDAILQGKLPLGSKIREPELAEIMMRRRIRSPATSCRRATQINKGLN